MMPRLLVEAPMSECEAAAWTTSEERAVAARFQERRRREWLAWRALVRRELGAGVAICYDAVGAPVISGPGAGGLRIAVAHCPGRVAVGFSDAPCGVDIERRDRDFSRALSRYLTPEECGLAAGDVWPGVAWCAKEALYKRAGRRELDLRDDLRLLRADLRAVASDASSVSGVSGVSGAGIAGVMGAAADVSGRADASLVRGASGAGQAGVDLLDAGASGTGGDGLPMGPEPPASLLPLAGYGEVVGRIGDGEPVRLIAWWNEEVILVSTV